MPENFLLLSIKPEYANKIFTGEKKVELRRVRTRLKSDDLVFVYVTSPKKALVGLFEVDKVIIVENLQEKQQLNKFWKEVEKDAAISGDRFKTYYQGASLGVGIFIKNPDCFSQPITLPILRETLPNFNPPQSYRYLNTKEVNIFEFMVKSKITETGV